MINWPWVSRKTLDENTERLNKIERIWRESQAEIDRLKQVYHDNWEPLLKKLTKLEPRWDRANESFRLQVAFDRRMVEQVAGYNDEHVWEYFTEEVAYHLKRQLLSLNFAGLHRLAQENEYRYPYTLKPW